MMYAVMILVSFFAAYGMVQLIFHWVFSYRTQNGKNPVCCHMVLGLYNAEDSAEALLRTLTWEERMDEIIILDFGSEDDTSGILSRLSLKYPGLHVMHPEEYVSYLRCLEERCR